MVKLIYPQFWQERKLISYLLLPFSILYFIASKLRALFAIKIIFPAKVICVGNISVGGTGKTQIVIYLAKWLSRLGVEFVIITKAYNSSLKTAKIVDGKDDAQSVGDESIVLNNYGRVIAARKIQYTKDLIAKLRPEVIIVDDGMQNPYFHKDFTILAIDGMRKLGNEFLMPAGPLRESRKSGEQKADVIVTVGGDSSFKSSKKNFNAKIGPIDQNLDKTKGYFAFCGIGNPDKFLLTIKELNLKLLGHEIFPDHHNYTEDDIEFLSKKAQMLGATLITTEKDRVKTQRLQNSVCLKIELIIDQDQEFLSLISNACINGLPHIT
jgi:tetraacyldisaccharide 4'-kinase